MIHTVNVLLPPTRGHANVETMITCGCLVVATQRNMMNVVKTVCGNSIVKWQGNWLIQTEHFLNKNNFKGPKSENLDILACELVSLFKWPNIRIKLTPVIKASYPAS